MTRRELLEIYEHYKGIDNVEIELHIHMPDDSIEIIRNANPAEKMEYLGVAYDDNLVHKNNKEIYITDVYFLVDDTMGFGNALCKLRAGKRLTRKGWNGKGMFIYYVPSGEYLPCTKVADKYCTDDFGKVPYRAYIAFKAVDDTVVPWVASQTDLLADDWIEVE